MIGPVFDGRFRRGARRAALLRIATRNRLAGNEETLIAASSIKVIILAR